MALSEFEKTKLTQYQRSKVLEDPVFIEYTKNVVKDLEELTSNEERLAYVREALIDLLEAKIKDPMEVSPLTVNLDPRDMVIEFLKSREQIFVEISQMQKGASQSTLGKIHWNATPALFGFIFHELARQGYFDYPLFNGEINYSELGRQFLRAFEVESTPQNVIKEFNPNKNSLSETKRKKFQIPHIADLQ